MSSLEKMNISFYNKKYEGQSALILGTGPSLKDFTPEQLEFLAKDKVVIALKQAYDYCPGICRFHFLNSANIQTYNYKRPIPIMLMLAANEVHWEDKIPHHFLFHVKQNIDFSQSLSATYAFDDVDVENRPDELIWGPGILWSTVLPMSVYMGFSHIYTIGVDLGKEGETSRNHFYGRGNRVNVLSKRETSGEVALSGKYYQYLQSKNIDWTILSENSYLHKDIPRNSILTL